MRWRLILCLAVMLGQSPSALGAQPRELGLLPEPQGDLLGFENPGDVPTLPETGELVVEKVRPADCCVVLGFVHSPIDGRVDSWGYNGVVNEYDNSQGYGPNGHWQNVTYEHIKNPGVHVTLADVRGFNYLTLRGGFVGDVYRDVDSLDGPGKGKKLLEVARSTGPTGPDHFRISRHRFSEPVQTPRISFFRRDRLLSDAQCFRVGAAALPETHTGQIQLGLGEPVDDLSRLGPDFIQLPAQANQQHPSTFHRRFFRPSDRAVYQLTTATNTRAIRLAPSQQLHLVTPVLQPAMPLGAVQFDLHLAEAPKGGLLCLAVQDPLVGSQELLRIDLRQGKSQRVRCLLDFPDQLIPEGGRLWITLASEHAATLAPDSRITLLTVPPEKARNEHLAYRLTLLKGYFSVLSEARPWNGGPGRNMSLPWLLQYDGAEWNIQRLRPQLLDLYRTVEHLKQIAPAHPIAVRQYYAWLNRSGTPPLEPNDVPQLPHIPGVPRWAQLLDRAARAAVAIPDWWLAHRMAPNGEFGGFLGDDTDMLQWWVPSLMLDSQRFAPRAREAFQRINHLVLQHNLRDGVNLTVTDPLHAYEEGVNHTSLMPLLFYGHPQHLEQTMLAARTTEKWLVRTGQGTLRFRTNKIGWKTAQNPPPQIEPASDTAALLLHPHLILAWYRHDPRALQTIEGYLRDHGHDVPNAYGGGWSLSLGAYWLSRDPWYLHLPPDGRDARGNWWARFHPELVVHGREAWQQPWWNSYRRNIASQWRLGDWAWATGQDRKTLEKSLEYVLWGYPGSNGGGAERFHYMWTEAEQFADRVFLPIETVAQAMLGGYGVRNRLWPAYAVSYENLGGDFAALVLQQGRDRLKLVMINLRTEPRRGAFRVWQLDHAHYRLKRGTDLNDDGQIDKIDASQLVQLKRMDLVPVELLPRQLTIYELTQTQPLPSVYDQPDLAISNADISRHGENLRLTVHNVGRQASKDCAVALLDPKGKQLARRPIPSLPPSRDFEPSRLAVDLPPVPGAAQIVLDPDERVTEITKANNAATIH